MVETRVGSNSAGEIISIRMVNQKAVAMKADADEKLSFAVEDMENAIVNKLPVAVNKLLTSFAGTLFNKDTHFAFAIALNALLGLPAQIGGVVPVLLNKGLSTIAIRWYDGKTDGQYPAVSGTCLVTADGCFAEQWLLADEISKDDTADEVPDNGDISNEFDFGFEDDEKENNDDEMKKAVASDFWESLREIVQEFHAEGEHFCSKSAESHMEKLLYKCLEEILNEHENDKKEQSTSKRKRKHRNNQ